MEPRHRAAPAMSAAPATDGGRFGLRVLAAVRPAARARVRAGPRAARRGHQVRPRRSTGRLPRPRAAPVGRGGRASVSCRTRPTATCGRWAASSGLGDAARPCPAGWCSGCGWGLVIAVAFAGAARLTRALGVRSDLACLVAGFAFALSPRVLTTLGPISIEAWPSRHGPVGAAAAGRGASAGRRAGRRHCSALAVAMVGGVNAAATFAVLPLGGGVAADPHARAAAARADALVARLHAAGHVVVAGPAVR